MRFADLQTGQTLTAGPYVLDEAELLAFARHYDPQWFHTDPEAAANGRFKGLIASGWQTCGIAMRLATEAVLAGSESFASPGIEYARWPHPVRAGDALTLTATLLEVRRARSRDGLGVLRWRWQLHNQAGTEVLDLTVTSLFDLSN